MSNEKSRGLGSLVRRKEIPETARDSVVPDRPPIYTSPSTSAAPPTPLSPSRSLPAQYFPPQVLVPLPIPVLPYHAYLPPTATISADSTTITLTNHGILTSDPIALHRFLQEQVCLPPKPLLKIKGTQNPNAIGKQVDFELSLNLMPLIVRGAVDPQTGTGRGGWNYLTTEGGVSMEEWCRRFCSDQSDAKSFTLTRTPQHLDTSYLSGQIRNLVASTPTPYTGTLSITFPSTHSTLVIAKTAPPKNWLERLVGPKAKSREYKPVESVWPFATAPPGTSAAMGMGMGRECAVQSEGEWWRVWEGAIRAGVVGRRKGWVGVEEWVEGAMGGSGSGSGKVEGIGS